MYDLVKDLGRQTVQYEVANKNVLSVQFVVSFAFVMLDDKKDFVARRQVDDHW